MDTTAPRKFQSLELSLEDITEIRDILCIKNPGQEGY